MEKSIQVITRNNFVWKETKKQKPHSITKITGAATMGIYIAMLYRMGSVQLQAIGMAVMSDTARFTAVFYE